MVLLSNIIHSVKARKNETKLIMIMAQESQTVTKTMHFWVMRHYYLKEFKNIGLKKVICWYYGKVAYTNAPIYHTLRCIYVLRWSFWKFQFFLCAIFKLQEWFKPEYYQITRLHPTNERSSARSSVCLPQNSNTLVSL
jgi:hypothetical protein